MKLKRLFRRSSEGQPSGGKPKVELINHNAVLIALTNQGFNVGRFADGNKVGPRTTYWNACIFTEDGTQVWWGDIDPVLEAESIQRAANDSGATLLVTPEQPFRWVGLKKAAYDAYDRTRIVTFTPEEE